MSDPDSYHILLVHPPVASPTIYPWALAYTGSCIAGWGVSLNYYDANLDFFLSGIFLNTFKYPYIKGAYRLSGIGQEEGKTRSV